MAYNSTASLKKLTCINYVDFGNCHDRIRQFIWSKKIPISWIKTQSFQERRQQRVPTGPKSYNGRSIFQPVYAIEESACHSSRKLR